MPAEQDYTFVFADLAGYTALTEAHGDRLGANVALRFFELARKALRGDARIVKTLGDGVMMVAGNVLDGLQTAASLLEKVAAERHFPAVRVGLHVGPALMEAGDFFGAAVNLTARVMQAGKPGQATTTEHVAAIATENRLARAEPLQTVRLKNVPHLVALYALHFGAYSETQLSHIDPVCKMRLESGVDAELQKYGEVDFHFCSRECADKFRAAPEAYLVPAATEPRSD